MPTLKNANLKGFLVLAGVAVITAAIGFATTAPLAARNTQNAVQEPARPGGWRGPGMMGQGMMGPGGPGRGGPGGGPFGMFGAGLRGLDLTDAQREQVRAIMESHNAERQAIAERMRTARQALHETIAADGFDEGAVRAKAAEVAALDVEVAVLQAKIHAAVYAILTPEQVKKAKELRTEMENRVRGGRGRGMRPHPAPRPEPSVEGDSNFPETV